MGALIEMEIIGDAKKYVKYIESYYPFSCEQHGFNDVKSYLD